MALPSVPISLRSLYRLPFDLYAYLASLVSAAEARLTALEGTAAAPAGTVGGSRYVRNVVVSNVANLASYAVASANANDNVSGGNAQGDRIALVAQSTPAQNGIYSVGVVSTGNAPLTRVADLPTGFAGQQGLSFFVQEGSVFAGTNWFATRLGGFTIGTNDPAFYPRRYTRITTAMAGTPGTKTLNAEWILDANKSAVHPVAKAPAGTQGDLSVGTLTAGAGNGAVTISSSANETSTLQVTFEN